MLQRLFPCQSLMVANRRPRSKHWQERKLRLPHLCTSTTSFSIIVHSRYHCRMHKVTRTLVKLCETSFFHFQRRLAGLKVETLRYRNRYTIQVIVQTIPDTLNQVHGNWTRDAWHMDVTYSTISRMKYESVIAYKKSWACTTPISIICPAKLPTTGSDLGYSPDITQCLNLFFCFSSRQMIQLPSPSSRVLPLQ